MGIDGYVDIHTVYVKKVSYIYMINIYDFWYEDIDTPVPKNLYLFIKHIQQRIRNSKGMQNRWYYSKSKNEMLWGD